MMMLKFDRTAPTFLLVSALGGAALLVTSGCEDAASKQAQQNAEQIIDARSAYLEAVASENKVASLQSVASGLPAGSESEGAALMTATAQLDAAERMIAEARGLEEENRSRRTAVHGIAAAALQLSSLAEAHEGFDDAPVRSILSGSSQRVDETIRSIQQQIDELEEPVAAIEAANAAAGQQVAALRAQSRDLREQAFAAGDLSGHALVRQAVDIDKQADAIEAEMATREIELMGLRSQLDVAEVHRDLLNDRKQKTADASESVSQTIAQFDSIAGEVRSRLSELRNQVATAMQAIDANAKSLDALYGEAEDAADGAAHAASSVQSRDTPAAAMLEARAQQARGRSMASKAAGLADHALLLTKLRDVGDPIGAGQYTGQLAGVTGAAESASAESVSAFTEAMALVERAGGDRDAALLKQLLNQAATGEPVDFSQFLPDEPDSPAGTGGTTSSSGFQSHDQLMAHLRQIAGQPDSLSRMLDLVHVPNASAQQMMDAFRGWLASAQALDAAVQSRFPQVAQQFNMMQMIGMFMPDFSGAAVVDQSDSRAVYSIRNGLGMADQMTLVKVGESWWLDGADMQDASATAQLQQQSQVFADLARRVQAGEFANEQQLQAAMQQAMGGG